MRFDLSAIPESHAEPAAARLQDPSALAEDIGFAAVVQALAPLLGSLDPESRVIVSRVREFLTQPRLAIAS
jgi:hypothetical protein